MYSTKGDRGRKELVFNEGDWVWLHHRKDRFPIVLFFNFSIIYLLQIIYSVSKKLNYLGAKFVFI